MSSASCFVSKVLRFASCVLCLINHNNFFTFGVRFGEVLEWLKRHAWKACVRQKRTAGSNPALSAAFFTFLPDREIERAYQRHPVGKHVCAKSISQVLPKASPGNGPVLSAEDD